MTHRKTGPAGVDRCRGMRGGWLFSLALAGSLIAWPAAAQEDSPANPTESATTPATAPPASAPLPGEVDRPVVEPQAKPWVSARPTRVGVPAASVDLDPAIIGPPPGQPAPALRREGDFVVEQLGRLRLLPSGVAVFDFVNDPKVQAGEEEKAPPGAGNLPGVRLPSMVLQPCQRLESMLRAAEQQGDAVLFRLTGQVHVYRGLNYLLPTAITGYETDETPASEVPDAEALDDAALAQAAAAIDEDDAPVVRVGIADRSQPRDPAAMMDDMASDLAKDVTDRRRGLAGGISAPLDPQRLRERTAAARGDDGPGVSAPLRREGELMVSRAGRITRASDARQVLFLFEADGPTLAEAPIALLSCRLRAVMEDAVAERGDAQAFTVTGRVYQFQGQNFLLPTTVKLRIDSDHLGG